MQRICYFPFIPLPCIKWFTACYRGWEPRFKTQRQAVGLRQGLFLIRNCVSTACTLALRFNVLITKEFFCIWVRIMAASSRKTVLELAFSEVCSSTMTTFYIVIKHSFTEFDAMANKLNFVLGIRIMTHGGVLLQLLGHTSGKHFGLLYTKVFFPSKR